MEHLTESEKTAERIYNLLRNGKMGKHTFKTNFQRLAEKKDWGIQYLMYLLIRSNHVYTYTLLIECLKSTADRTVSCLGASLMRPLI